MKRKEQYSSVLSVLVDMQTCLDANDTYTKANGHSFNLSLRAGICWHVLAYTPNSDISGIGMDYLMPVFEQMGLDPRYPVEMQVVDTIEEARKIHTWATNQYNVLGEEGQLRRKLLKELIKYYTKAIALL